MVQKFIIYKVRVYTLKVQISPILKPEWSYTLPVRAPPAVPILSYFITLLVGEQPPVYYSKPTWLSAYLLLKIDHKFNAL
jgi:hypothetical protein